MRDSKTYIADHSQFKAHEDHRQHLSIQHGDYSELVVNGSIEFSLYLPIIVKRNRGCFEWSMAPWAC